VGTLLRLSVGVDGELARLAPRARRLARQLPGVTKRQRRHESPQRMIRREHAVIPVPVLSWWWHQIRKTI
jgi:hypothetical protein